MARPALCCTGSGSAGFGCIDIKTCSAAARRVSSRATRCSSSSAVPDAVPDTVLVTVVDGAHMACSLCSSTSGSPKEARPNNAMPVIVANPAIR
jgi:hypothetical protein